MQQRGRSGLFPKQLAGNVSNILNKRGFSHDAVLKYWADAVGDNELAKHCFPVKLSNMVLIVRVHPAYNAILAHQTGVILQRLHQLLGVRVAHKITIIN